MKRIAFKTYGEKIKKWAEEQAKKMDRGEANFEDDLRTAMELLTGLKINNDAKAQNLEEEINKKLNKFIKNILKTEKDFFQRLKRNKFIAEDFEKFGQGDEIFSELVDKEYLTEGGLPAEKFFQIKKEEFELNIEQNKKKELYDFIFFNPFALLFLQSFLISFTSRTATRERLNIFTTNYDRFIEYGCDMAGIMILDRFFGKIKPVFRTTRVDLDYHYNPPGIRGEPRYVEGVVRLTKLHGSIDWRFEGKQIVKASLPFGADENHPEIPEDPMEYAVIYPNSFKGIDTVFYPYSELFRDFASAICRPNSAVVTYGYGFGDSHINRILEDMLTIPSTHLVIISYDDASGRIKKFYEKNNEAQITLLIGKHFGDLKNLVKFYLPKAAIDRITQRMNKIMENRAEVNELLEEENTSSGEKDGNKNE